MKKNIFIVAFAMIISFTQFTYAQVGIGNTNPQQELHISGSSSTIRVEGLNSTNNTNNNGTDLAPVVVDANGDFTIASPMYGENMQYIVLPIGSQTIISTSLTNIIGATVTFTPKHATIFVSFAVSGYNPLCFADQQSYFVAGLSKDGTNVGNFLSMSASTSTDVSDATFATGAATITAANFPLTVTPGVSVTIQLQGRVGGSVHDCGFEINKTNYTSYITILD